ncbi:MAG: hypothetical protein A3A80_03015 [Candidatus Terrybacteria bacterium RIFCSPLOWO2_01_FULL_44_24]|uniref:Uncharacterized protein n=1 Tax=Candidatus Terrybacteria bacterium RIFCSPHIGHO2_01_FULL_43_35 TaxID=1802361 RepID=A0A1G2PEY4_9BACT|nr:MAG: hypothetical protein A2828_03200 [Candidatus Terrybacteria bacterium RIFCSPHIGHO2_01_FULL_43_35]OHA50114.1 MAG: hypothetical protein A3B75_01210 [Candidatus Terrybacteria bacterium RIFCSPHIGHO2_02_FULL_43_14]OHA51035.1 MAG: hypothetical protein A3A80_03015 [Candidatus Terrybacteria bacterium RIFCSPLOWO2_01_FULL_44_24]
MTNKNDCVIHREYHTDPQAIQRDFEEQARILKNKEGSFKPSEVEKRYFSDFLTRSRWQLPQETIIDCCETPCLFAEQCAGHTGHEYIEPRFGSNILECRFCTKRIYKNALAEPFLAVARIVLWLPYFVYYLVMFSWLGWRIIWFERLISRIYGKTDWGR